MSDEPVPDYVPAEWITETGQYLLESTWRALLEMGKSQGLDRVRYIIVPEQVYDAVIGALDEEGDWLCPDGYYVAVLVADTWM